MKEINELTTFFNMVNKFSYCCGLPNFLNSEINLPPFIVKYNRIYVKIVNVILTFFVVMENVAFITQKNLTEKQQSDLMTFGLTHFILYIYYLSLVRNRVAIRKIVYNLTISLKKIHNDNDVERATIKKSKLYIVLFLSLCCGALLFYGLEAVIMVIRNEGRFVTVVTAWPDVDDDRTFSNATRFLFYILWWFFMFRVMSLYSIVIISTIYLSYQYQNVQSYFRSLVTIFEEDISQQNREKKYENALKVGIQLHKDTLSCTKESQQTFNTLFSVQVLMNTLTLVLLMIRLMTSEHSPMNMLATGVMATAILIATGLFIWNLGDVTVEAAKVPTAIYCSGWENCTRGCSARVRLLLCFAMMQGQTPVVTRALGVVELSYTSYVTLVKSSYSVFSVFY